MSARILIAEDDDLTLELLTKVIEREGHQVIGVSDGADALSRLAATSFDLVLTDVQMARASGMEVLEAVSRDSPDTPVILITAYAEPNAAMDAIARGAADYLAKPVDVMALRNTVARALERRRLQGENRRLRGEAGGERALIGTSAPMLDLYKQLAHIAPTDATVLITGESGSGKELVARTLHARSRRSTGPFVAVNCAALTESLLESELFGHDKGAFTGAHTQHKGVFEAAHGGTLFLDEIGDVPPKMQAQLLRVLQEGALRRVGGSSEIPVDVRVIVATHRDLAVEVAEQRFRADLYYRLNVVALRVPSLRERGDDLVALARHLSARHAAPLGRQPPDLADETLAALRAHPWPGNVRELENALARAVALSRSGVILPSDLPPNITGAATPARAALDEDWPTLETLQRRYIDKVLSHSSGNKTEAATILGVDRRTLQRLFAKDES